MPHRNSVLRIRDVYPGSRIQLFPIPDPGSELSPSGIRIKEFKYFKPKKKKKKKWFLSSRKYDPSCSSRIRMQTFYLSRIPDPGIKKAPDAGSGSATLSQILTREHTMLAIVYKHRTIVISDFVS